MSAYHIVNTSYIIFALINVEKIPSHNSQNNIILNGKTYEIAYQMDIFVSFKFYEVSCGNSLSLNFEMIPGLWIVHTIQYICNPILLICNKYKTNWFLGYSLIID